MPPPATYISSPPKFTPTGAGGAAAGRLGGAIITPEPRKCNALQSCWRLWQHGNGTIELEERLVEEIPPAIHKPLEMVIPNEGLPLIILPPHDAPCCLLELCHGLQRSIL